MSKEKSKDVKNFKHNTKVVKKALKEAGITKQKDTVDILDGLIAVIGKISRDDKTKFSEISDQVVLALTLAEAVRSLHKKQGKKPTEHMSLALASISSMGKSLAITNMISGKSITIDRFSEFKVKVVKL